MKIFILLLLLFITFKKIESKTQKEVLILISFDGFRWDYLENNTLPNFSKYFIKQGSKITKGLINAFSTVTFPNHWTLSTGLTPESHGKYIYINFIYQIIFI
jgi:predicted AlkP superfamily pyrophosphatase or phosphodiesterase